MPVTLQRLPSLKRASKQDLEQGNLIDQLLAERKLLQTPVARIIKVPTNKSPAARKAAVNTDPFHSTNRDPNSAIPESSITLPTTRHVGREAPGSATAADQEALVPQHAATWPGFVLRSRIPLALLVIVIGFIQPWAALPPLLLAELLERRLFFQSVHAPKMPGNFGPERRH